MLQPFRFDAATFVQPGCETQPGDWPAALRQAIARIRELHPELSHWGDLAIGSAFGCFSQDVLEVSWADWVALERDEMFLEYCCWRQTRGDWKHGLDIDRMAQADEWRGVLSFHQFQALKPHLLASRPSALDCTETKMAQVLQPLLPSLTELERAPQGYRCHVASHWLSYFGLASELKPQVLVSQGVRHGLQSLFGHYAKAGKRILLPTDVYPVYLDMAQRAGLAWQGYEAWAGFDAQPLGDAEVLLLTNPLKPKGTRLTEQEASTVLGWLQADPGRRVLVDVVYTFENQLDPMTRRLFDHGQALVLHSLSKGWAQPLVAGVALVPASDAPELTNVFRCLPVDRERLSLAEALLTQGTEHPRLLADILQQKAVALAQQLASRGAPVPDSLKNPLPGQYLFALACSWEHPLERHGVLALPLSVFGSTRDGCVVSSLG